MKITQKTKANNNANQHSDFINHRHKQIDFQQQLTNEYRRDLLKRALANEEKIKKKEQENDK